MDDRAIAVERRFHVVADRQPQVGAGSRLSSAGTVKPHWEVIVEIDGVRPASGSASGLAGPSQQDEEAQSQRAAAR